MKYNQNPKKVKKHWSLLYNKFRSYCISLFSCGGRGWGRRKSDLPLLHTGKNTSSNLKKLI
jgi:hypothetical protein